MLSRRQSGSLIQQGLNSSLERRGTTFEYGEWGETHMHTHIHTAGELVQSEPRERTENIEVSR